MDVGQNWQAVSLPTEAEWGYACRGWTSTARFWGDNRAGAQWYANVADRSLLRELKASFDPERFFNHDNGFPFTSPVVLFDANPFGPHDMLGNLWDWVQDYWHDGYSDAPDDGTAWRTGASDALNAFRGGSWICNPPDVRAGIRYSFQFGGRITDTGFRLARTL